MQWTCDIMKNLRRHSLYHQLQNKALFEQSIYTNSVLIIKHENMNAHINANMHMTSKPLVYFNIIYFILSTPDSTSEL